MQTVSNEYKELAKSNARITLTKFILKDSNTVIDEETIIEGFIEEMTCDDDHLVGNVMAKNLEAKLYNNFTNDYIGKEIEVYTGMLLSNNTKEYVPRGTFIIDEIEEDVSSGTLKIKGFDYAVKFNKAWVDPLDWELKRYTLGEFAKTVCEFCDLELENDNFPNSDYLLTEQPFFEGYQCRYVMQKIAEIAVSNVFITEDDKVRIGLAPENYIAAEGSSMTLEDSGNNRLKIEELEGDTFQEQTTQSANLFDENYYNNDSIYTSGAYKYTLSRVQGNRVLYFKARLKEGKEKQTGVYIAISDSAGSPYMSGTNSAYAISNGNATSQSKDFTGITTLYINIYPNTLDCATIFDNYDIWLCTTNSQTYVPFVPDSPSPDYPQEIQVVTGNQEIEVCGKNLLNINGQIVKREVATYSNIKVENNTLSYNILSSAAGYLGYVIPLTIGEQYTLSWSEKTGTIYTIELDEKINQVGTNYGSSRYSGYTFIASKPYLGVWLSQNILVSDTASVSNLMVEKGSTATEYEPYIGNKYEINLGKNLFNINDCYVGSVQQPYMSMDITNNVMTLTATGTVGAQLSRWEKGGFDSSKTYTCSFKAKKVVKGTDGLPKIQFVVYGSNDGSTFSSIVNMNETNPTQGQEYSFNYTFTGYKYYRFYIYNNASSPVTIGEQTQYYDIQFEEGSIVTPYSPYFTPIELCKIGNYQDSIYKGVGSNLLDNTTPSLTGSTITWTPTPTGGTFTNSGTWGDGVQWRFTLDTTKQYTLQMNTPSSSNLWVYIRTYTDDTYSTLKTSVLADARGDINKTFIPDSQYVMIRIANSTALSNIEIANMMLNKGVSLPYEPYLAKGKWYIEKNIGKVVLDGSESGWALYNARGSQPRRFGLYQTKWYKNSIPLLSDYFIGGEYNSQVDLSIWTQTSYLAITDKNSKWANANALKTWLSTHNTIVYYVLATPTYTEITNEELISQLDAIDKARSVDGQTNITITSSNLPFLLSLQYDKKVTEDVEINSLMSLEVEDTTYRPFNAVTLALADGIEGENVTLRDDYSISTYGERALIITANEFAINQAVREVLIQEMFNAINGFNYVPMKAEYNSYDWLERFDRIKVEYNDNEFYDTYLFNHTTQFPSSIKSSIEVNDINGEGSKLEYIPETQQAGTHTEIVVDKLNNRITSTVSRVEDAEGNIAGLTKSYTTIEADYKSVKSTAETAKKNYDDLSVAGLNAAQLAEVSALDTAVRSYVDQEIDRITTIITKTGGNNRIRNSVGFKGIDYWTLSEGGTATTSQATEVEQTTISGSEIILTNGTLRTDYTTIVGGRYTISFKIKKTSIGAANEAKIELHRSENDYTVLYQTMIDQTKWKEIEYSYNATTATPYLVFDCGGDKLEISDLIVNDGDKQSWSQYFDEVYGKTHQLDTSGLTLKAENSDETSHLDNNDLIFEKSGTIKGELSGDRVKSDTAEITSVIKLGEFTYQIIDRNNLTLY